MEQAVLPSVSLGFFDDIIIPPSSLQHPSRFDETEQAWVWEYDTGDGGTHDLFMDAGEPVRFKVTAEMFNETCPSGPAVLAPMTDNAEKAENKVAYVITVRISLSCYLQVFISTKLKLLPTV